MFSNIGSVGVIVLVMAALVIYGPSKLPELGKTLGKTLKAFKGEMVETVYVENTQAENTENTQLDQNTEKDHSQTEVSEKVLEVNADEKSLVSQNSEA